MDTEASNLEVLSGFETSGSLMHYRMIGAAGSPVVVMLHGGAESGQSFIRVARLLADSFCIVLPDMPGHGDSAWLNPGGYERLRLAKRLSSFVSAVSPFGVDLVGQSLGARLALAVADVHPQPQNIRHLALIDTAPDTDEGGRGELLRAISTRPYADIDSAARALGLVAEGVATDREIERTLRHVRLLDDGSVDLKFDPYFSNLVTDETAQRAVRGEASALRLEASRIKAPCLIIRGANSPLVSRSAAIEFAEKFNRGSVCEIPHAGHFVNRDNPSGLASALRSFLTFSPIHSNSRYYNPYSHPSSAAEML